MIKQVHYSLTAHENLWTLKFDKFTEFQNVITDKAPPKQPSLWSNAYEIDMWLPLTASQIDIFNIYLAVAVP